MISEDLTLKEVNRLAEAFIQAERDGKGTFRRDGVNYFIVSELNGS